MKHSLLVSALALFLAACGTTTLTKPGLTQAEFESDKSQCEFEAVKHASSFDNSYSTSVGSAIDQAMRRREITLACMKAKGYTPQ